MYDGVVKQKEEAQQQYTQAVSRGQSAGIVRCVWVCAGLSKPCSTVIMVKLLTRHPGHLSRGPDLHH